MGTPRAAAGAAGGEPRLPMMTYDEPFARKSTVFSVALFFLTFGILFPLICFKGCEAVGTLWDTPLQVAADVTSPDGNWRLRATRDPGMDGDAPYTLLLARG